MNSSKTNWKEAFKLTFTPTKVYYLEVLIISYQIHTHSHLVLSLCIAKQIVGVLFSKAPWVSVTEGKCTSEKKIT